MNTEVKVEIHAYIKGRVALSIPPKQVYNELNDIYGPSPVSYMTVCRWVKKIIAGISSIKDAGRQGRPKTSVTDKNMSAVKAFVDEDRRYTVEEIANKVGISEGSVHAILTKHLGLTKKAIRSRVQQVKQILTRCKHETGCETSELSPDPEEMKAQVKIETRKVSLTEQDHKQVVFLLDEVLGLTEEVQNTKQNSGKKLCLPHMSSVKVQVFMPQDISKEFDIELSKLCKGLSKCTMISRINDLQENIPLIVVCPIQSRFETDIRLALSGLNWSSIFLTLLVHSGTKKSLPSLPTATRFSDKTKYNSEFIDIAFNKESKFYKCDMNDDAKKKLKSFLDSYR